MVVFLPLRQYLPARPRKKVLKKYKKTPGKIYLIYPVHVSNYKKYAAKKPLLHSHKNTR